MENGNKCHAFKQTYLLAFNHNILEIKDLHFGIFH